MRTTRIAIVGAGIGGLAAAISLQRIGLIPQVFEQAAQFRRIGAAIALTPNSVKVLDGLGVGDQIRIDSFSPSHRISRTWDTGAVTSKLELGDEARTRYGAPQLMVHRADLLSALEAALSPGVAYLNARVAGISQDADCVTLMFEDGSSRIFDAVIGADGIHSTLRASLFGETAPIYSGMAAYRCIVPTADVSDYDWRSFVKWWGPNPLSQIVTAAIDRGRQLFVFATKAEPEISRESWSAESNIDDLRAAFRGYHADAQEVLSACSLPLKTALYMREPMRSWTAHRIALLGDACHPMLPFMAQGAAMALEDAAILSRCIDRSLQSGKPLSSALVSYERTRHDRATRIQRGSNQNEWLRTADNADWVYCYNAWTEPIA